MEKKELETLENRLQQKTNSILEILKGVSFDEIEWILKRVQYKVEGNKGTLSFS